MFLVYLPNVSTLNSMSSELAQNLPELSERVVGFDFVSLFVRRGATHKSGQSLTRSQHQVKHF